MKTRLFLAVIQLVTLGGGMLLLMRRPIASLFLTVGAVFLRYQEVRIAPIFTSGAMLHWVVGVAALTLLGLAYEEARHAA
jgi:hypothetical protein